jgi:hypothetical protein
LPRPEDEIAARVLRSVPVRQVAPAGLSLAGLSLAGLSLAGLSLASQVRPRRQEA